jgi:hypothetical protein
MGRAYAEREIVMYDTLLLLLISGTILMGILLWNYPLQTILVILGAVLWGMKK